MTYTQKLTKHMEWLEQDVQVHLWSNHKIAISYYNNNGVKQGTTFTMWAMMVASGKLPAYETVVRSIRKSRELTPRWKKPVKTKGDQVEHVANTVGYRKGDTL